MGKSLRGSNNNSLTVYHIKAFIDSVAAFANSAKTEPDLAASSNALIQQIAEINAYIVANFNKLAHPPQEAGVPKGIVTGQALAGEAKPIFEKLDQAVQKVIGTASSSAKKSGAEEVAKADIKQYEQKINTCSRTGVFLLNNFK
jgi:hypothetical protein